MKALPQKALVIGVVGVLILLTPAMANVFLLDFYGYDYWTPDDCYNSVGFITDPVNADYLTFDFANNEYTYVVKDVCLVSTDTVSVFVIFSFSGGTVDIYCDPTATGTAADFGINPENATSPATFEDGENVLGATFTNIQIVLNLTTLTANLDGQITLDRGTQLGNIPVDQRGGWTLAGQNQNVPGIPEGYWGQIDGQIFISDPIATERSTWGELKTKFQEGN